MVDSLTPDRRSWNMSRIRGSNTAPEKQVRSILHAEGYRFRLHDKTLPGKPDIVLPKYRSVILVHGCFWHRHAGCRLSYSPKSRIEFWQAKFARTVERDKENLACLNALGWKALVIWECQITDTEKLIARINKFLQQPSYGSDHVVKNGVNS